MNVFIPDVHSTLTHSFCEAFDRLGATVYVPLPGASHGIHVAPSEPLLKGVADFRSHAEYMGVTNCRFVELEALPDLEIDVVVLPDKPLQRSVLRYLHPLFSRRREVYLVFFCGNEMPSYRWDLVQNLLCADEKTWHARGSRVPHALRYFPYVDYDTYAFRACSDVPALITCINHFEKRYPQEAAWAREIVSQVPGVEHRVIGGLAPREVAAQFQSSTASLHIKHEEGYGYAVIESLAVGRPIIAPRKYVQGRTMARWCVQGESALLFDSTEEAVAQIRGLMDDGDLRERMQRRSAELIRQLVNNDEQTAGLQAFMQQLRPQPDKSLLNHLLDVRYRHRPQKV